MRMTTITRLLMALLMPFGASAVAAPPSTIVEQNFYYPKPGKEAEVLQTRTLASQVRRQIGLDSGRILLRQSSDTEGTAYVIWEIEYPSIEAREADMAARAASPDFESVRARMRTLIDRFERTVWTIQPEQDEPIVVQNIYYARPGKEADVLATRLEASRIRASLGLAVGRVLVKVDPGAEGQATVIWECEYPSLAEREKDAAAVEKSAEFTAIQARMRALIDNFERHVWRAAQTTR
jgi:hypothetical protein